MSILMIWDLFFFTRCGKVYMSFYRILIIIYKSKHYVYTHAMKNAYKVCLSSWQTSEFSPRGILLVFYYLSNYEISTFIIVKEKITFYN